MVEEARAVSTEEIKEELKEAPLTRALFASGAKVTVFVKDVETKKPIPRALVWGRKMFVPILPRMSDDEGKCRPFTVRTSFFYIKARKRGYKPFEGRVMVRGIYIPLEWIIWMEKE